MGVGGYATGYPSIGQGEKYREMDCARQNWEEGGYLRDEPKRNGMAYFAAYCEWPGTIGPGFFGVGPNVRRFVPNRFAPGAD